MKILGICGSPNVEDSTSYRAVEIALEEAEKQGFDTEIIHLGEYSLNPCQDCGACRTQLKCSQNDDFSNKILPKLDDDNVVGFILSSPVYFGGMTAQLKMFIDRAVMFRRNGFKFENKVAGAIAVGRSRNGGQELTVIEIAKAMMVHGMIIVPDSSPTSHFGGILHSGAEGGMENDETGIKTARNLGYKVAEISKKLNS
jgi:multimeric flavodoxin WrbA